MGQKIQAVKGMNDLLPVEQKDFKLTAAFWQTFENRIGQWAHRFGYRQIRTPIVEQTGLFVRSIGEDTDVVGKEMYTFADSNDTLSLSLRPEGTASCLRAVVEHNLLYNGGQKLWYMGPMFRRERPQKGRYRQFHQVGVEALGFEGPDIDAEIIAMCADLWRELGIAEHLTLEINSLGNREERAAHRSALVAYLQQHEDKLDDDSRRRLHTNPLRVLDTKNPELQQIADNAPALVDYLGEASQAHYDSFKALLDGLGIQYKENRRLVRGLDYYNQTVFEWTTDKLGAQATVCGGGRYDGLIEELGGKPAPSIGFALGIERLLLLVREYGSLKAEISPDIYIISDKDKFSEPIYCANLFRRLDFDVVQYMGSKSLRKQMELARKSGANFIVEICSDGDTRITDTKENESDKKHLRVKIDWKNSSNLLSLNNLLSNFDNYLEWIYPIYAIPQYPHKNKFIYSLCKLRTLFNPHDGLDKNNFSIDFFSYLSTLSDANFSDFKSFFSDFESLHSLYRDTILKVVEILKKSYVESDTNVCVHQRDLSELSRLSERFYKDEGEIRLCEELFNILKALKEQIRAQLIVEKAEKKIKRLGL